MPFFSVLSACQDMESTPSGLYFFFTPLNSQTLPSLLFWGSRHFCVCFLKIIEIPHYILLCEQLFVWCGKSCIIWLYALDPDEVIYDDVPRENSDSNTGLQFLFYSLNVLLPVCSLPLLFPFYYPLYSVKTYIVFFQDLQHIIIVFICIYLINLL